MREAGDADATNASGESTLAQRTPHSPGASASGRVPARSVLPARKQRRRAGAKIQCVSVRVAVQRSVCGWFLGAAVIFATSCATDESTSPTRSDTRVVCRAGTATPIRERTLKRELAARGFQLRRDDCCHSSADVRVLVTLSDAHGSVYCDVLRRNLFGSRIERFVWRNDRKPTYLRALNIDCSIFPESIADTNRLESALRRLPGVSAQSTTVPSPDAIHD